MQIPVYTLAYARVTIYNVNINSRKIDGYYRSWVEYLNEPYKLCIIDRSIK